MKRNFFSGFTLVELLVTIAVSGILLTVGIAALNPSQQINRGNDAKRKADLLGLQTALERYYSEFGDYPGNVNWCTQLSSLAYPQVRQALEPAFINKVPKDPKYADTTEDYFYWHHAAGQYRLYAVLENTSDPDVVEGVLTTDVGSGSCAGANASYNYRLISP